MDLGYNINVYHKYPQWNSEECKNGLSPSQSRVSGSTRPALNIRDTSRARSVKSKEITLFPSV